MKVKEIMRKGVEWVSPDTPVAILAEKMLELISALFRSEKTIG